ncbi:hypothetical protein EF913_32855 [Streptomyces sp. WAC04189]|uniref:hypothetical protein n=1 Tax=Streptomyces sp. WAC04189 TaxID=2487411 RepID=UPI000FB5F132|nr:hypothetical protein [Streptomyces sp. WAC04189]RSR96678.1 hypothetical protein EF913_32855 [Streptomyces sp. WAC04189]
MTNLVPPATVTRSPRRLWLPLALAALTLVTVPACGTEKTERAGADGPPSTHADTAGDRPGAAFTKMLDEVAHACPPSAAPEAPPTGPAEPSTPGPGETPPSDPIEPLAPTEGPEVELNARDWCAGVRHEQRIAEALWDLTDPTPTEVRTVLNDLGYIDERIHGLERSGTTTRFSLDLRDRGGRLCLNGSAAGEQTVVDMCVAPTTGPFTPAEQSAHQGPSPTP